MSRGFTADDVSVQTGRTFLVIKVITIVVFCYIEQSPPFLTVYSIRLIRKGLYLNGFQYQSRSLPSLV